MSSSVGVRGWPRRSRATLHGGTVVDIGGYRIHKFTNVGPNTLVVGGAGKEVDYFVVAGGGGGGNDAGGGGGGGGVLTGSARFLLPGSYIITIGNGGIITGNGENSVFDGLVAIGGGSGGSWNSGGGAAGGSGGGGGHTSGGGGAGTAGQGYAGAGAAGSITTSGGGGGAGGAGSGQTPGVGVTTVYDGSGSTFYAAGGPPTNGYGEYPPPIVPNRGTGGKGWARGEGSVARSGSSGIVIVRYRF